MADETKTHAEPEADAFSEEVYSSSRTGQSASASAAAESDAYTQQEEFREEPLRDLPQAPARKAAEGLNGISWKKKRRIARRDMITLNNGEPLSFAIRKITAELIVIALCAAVIIGFFFARELVLDKLTDDGIGALSMSTRYEAPQTVELNAAKKLDSPGYTCITMVGDWAGVPVDSTQLRREYDGRDITGLADGMEKELARAVTNKTVTRKENLSNYSLLTQIYDSLKDGRPVVVSCTAPDLKTVGWAVVTGIKPKDDLVSLWYSDGSAATLTLNDFLSSVRYESLAGNSIGTRLALAAGFFNKNTAFFFTPVEE